MQTNLCVTACFDMANQPFASHCQPGMLEENFLHSKLAESGGGQAAPKGSSQNK